MLDFWLAKIVAVSFIFHGGCSFLLDSSTVRPSGGSQYLTTRHYMQLMDLLYEEKQTRRQLEQIVTTLQTKVDDMSNNGGQQAVNITTYIQPYVTRLENQEKELATVRYTYTNLLQTKEAEIAKLHTTVTALEHNYTSLLHDSTMTQANYHKLKLEVEGLKQVKNLDVANGLQETTNEINMLKASNQARSQDFLALYNLTMSCKKDISTTKKEVKGIYNGSVIDTKIKELNDKLSGLEVSQNLTSMQANATDQALITKVGFTACQGYMVSGRRINFRTEKSSHGISMTSSYREGKFFAPKAGFYLVLSNIATSSQSGFYIKKNDINMNVAYAHFGGSDANGYTAPLSAYMKLSVNDVVTIEGDSVDHSSCLTIIQL